jgi:hypothetical protein
LASHAPVTTHIYCGLPEVRAALALIAHKPAEAVRLLQPVRPYQLRNFRIPYLRARAETEARMLDAATGDYRLILDNQVVDLKTRSRYRSSPMRLSSARNPADFRMPA